MAIRFFVLELDPELPKLLELIVPVAAEGVEVDIDEMVSVAEERSATIAA